MKKLIMEKIRPAIGNWGRQTMPGIYKIYETLFWKIVILRRKRGLHQKGYDYLEEMNPIMEKYGIKYFITYGTLLGIVRNGEFIPFDDDIDIGVIQDEKFSWRNLEKAMDEIGMKKKLQFRLNEEITEQTYRRSNLSVDFFLYKEKDGKSVSYVYYQQEGKEYKKNEFSVAQNITSLIEKTKKVCYKKGSFVIPEKPELFLEEIYGHDWKIPIAGWTKERDVVVDGKGRREKFS